MGTLLPAREDGRICRFDGHDPQLRPQLFQHLPGTRGGAASTHSGYEDIHLSVRVSPDLPSSGLTVTLGIGRVMELLWYEVSIVFMA